VRRVTNYDTTVVEGHLTPLECLSYKSLHAIADWLRHLNTMAATILIADDYEDNLELLRLLLVAADYQVIEARNGAECLKLARQMRPALIMVDLSMPVLDGWEMFRALRADELTASILCIAVTAHGDTDRDRALRAGFNAYVSKPFRGADLLETVARLLSSRPAATYAAESSLPRDIINKPLLKS
jgi:two-component system cell cycle response regulator DivK